MELLDQYYNIHKQILSYFGCDLDFLNIQDGRSFYWCDLKNGDILFSKKRESMVENINLCYQERIASCFSKHIYQMADYTMFTMSGEDYVGSEYLVIFDNKKEIKLSELSLATKLKE